MKWNVNKAPPAPDDWRSANELAREGMGGFDRLRRTIIQLREKLISEAVSAGMTADEAETVVERDLVGTRRRSAGPETNYASPTVIKLINNKHIKFDEIPDLPWSIKAVQRSDNLGKNR